MGNPEFSIANKIFKGLGLTISEITVSNKK